MREMEPIKDKLKKIGKIAGGALFAYTMIGGRDKVQAENPNLNVYPEKPVASLVAQQIEQDPYTTHEDPFYATGIASAGINFRKGASTDAKIDTNVDRNVPHEIHVVAEVTGDGGSLWWKIDMGNGTFDYISEGVLQRLDLTEIAAPSTPSVDGVAEAPTAVVVSGTESANAPEDAAVYEFAKFNSEPQMISSDGMYTVHYSEAYLQFLGIKNFKADSVAVTKAKDAMFADALSRLNVRLSQLNEPSLMSLDEVTLGSFRGGYSITTQKGDSTEIDWKAGNKIEQYVVVDEEWAAIANEIRTNPNSPKHIAAYLVGGGYPLELAIVYGVEDGSLHVISKPGRNIARVYSPISDGPGALSVMLSDMITYGMTKMGTQSVDAEKIFNSFKYTPGATAIPTIEVFK